MNNFLLDTSILIEILRNKKESVDFLHQHLKDKLFTSSICLTELEEGANLSHNLHAEKTKIKKLFQILSPSANFDDRQAEKAGKIRADLRKSGLKIDDFDTLIAACAISSQAILVTKNSSHFSRIPNLQTINPTHSS